MSVASPTNRATTKSVGANFDEFGRACAQRAGFRMARECVDGATSPRVRARVYVRKGEVMRVFSAALGADGRAARRRVAMRARNSRPHRAP
jgi:hypothetical protein